MAGKKDIVEQVLKLIMGGAETAAPKIRAYHASPYDFDVFKPSEFRGSTFFASTPERARRGADAGRNEMVMETATDLPPENYRTYEVEIDPTKIKGLHLTPSEIEWFGSLPQKIIGDEALEAATRAGMPHGLTWDDFYYYQPISESVFEYTKKAAPPSITYEDAYKTGRDVYRRQHSHYAPDADEKASAERMRQSGMGGYMLEDEGGTSLAVSDPEIVKILRKYASGGRTGYGPGGVIDDIVRMAGKIVSGADEPAATGIRAYHGSPHDFDSFDMHNIGTGEGAQAYGHGLYFAENEDIARDYRKKLSGDPKEIVFPYGDKDEYGMPIRFHPDSLYHKDPEAVAARAILSHINPKDQLSRIKEADVDRDTMAKAMRMIRNKEIATATPGHMYEVEIAADPNAFLDWDKPLSEQPETVRQVIERLGKQDEAKYGESGGLAYYLGDPESYSGESIYRYMSSQFEKPEASEILRSAGIPGIKYLDAGSRGAGEGTRNYVVFDDKLISIIRKYGIAGASAMLGYNLMDGLDSKQALAATMADRDFQSQKQAKADGGSIREGYQTKGRVVGDVVEQALKLVAGAGEQAAPKLSQANLEDFIKTHFPDASPNYSASNTDKYGPSSSIYYYIPSENGNKTIRLSDHDLGAREGVDLRYGEDLDMAKYKILKNFGVLSDEDLLKMFPKQIENEKINQLNSWQQMFDEHVNWVNNTKKKSERQTLIDEYLKTHPKPTFNSGGSVREGYGPGGIIDDVVRLAGKVISGEGDDAAQAGIRAYHGTPQKGLKRLSTRYAIETPDAVFAAQNPNVADTFTVPREYGEPVYVDDFGNDIEPGEVFEINLRPQNPFSVPPEDAQKFIDDTAFQTRLVRDAREKGHDLVIAPNVMEGIGERSQGDVYAVLDDRIISIIRKYGIAGASAMVGYDLMENLDPKQALAATMADRDYKVNNAISETDEVDDALRVAKDVGGSTSSPVMMEDAKGNKYDAQGNVIPQDNTVPNPQRVDMQSTYNALLSSTPPEKEQSNYEVWQSLRPEERADFSQKYPDYAAQMRQQDIAASEKQVRDMPEPYRSMTHPLQRFQTSKGTAKINAPLLGGTYEYSAPDVSDYVTGQTTNPSQEYVQAIYDNKTLPFYFTPAAPLAATADVAEGVINQDPLQAAMAALGYNSVSNLFGKGVSAAGRAIYDAVKSHPYITGGVLGAGSLGVGSDEAEAGPARWFSKAVEVARAIPMNKMTGEQALAMLRKGTSPEELRWTGTEDFLANTPQVTKQNLIDYINKNRIQTEDVVLGGSKPVRRDDVVPSETAIASMKNRWDELTARNREITDQMMLPPSERRASGDQLAEEQIAISDEMDTLHAKMIDDTIAEMGGLGTPPKFQTHSTSGGQGYEETLITLPNLPGTKPVEYQVFGAFPGTFKTREEAERHIKGIQEIEKSMPAFSQDIQKYPPKIEEIYEKPEFWEGHWDRSDVLAHVRSQILDVTPPGANRPFKGWNADEFQSKWGQEGRDLGFSKEIDPQIVHQLSEKRTELMFRHEAEREKFIKAYEAIQDEKIKDAYKNAPTQWDLPNALRQAQEARRKPHEAKFKEYKSNFLRQQNEFTPDQESILQDAFDSELETRIAYEDALKAEKEYKTTSGVSRAPYVTSTEGWTDLSIKKSLDKAIDSGADFFTWTPGEVHAKRYNLRSVVDEIQYDPKHRILFGRKGGRQVFEKDAVEPDKLGKYVGKEMASKLLSQPTIESKWYANPRHVLSDSELEIGGEGMINYYDKIVPKRVEEVIRKATGKKPKIEIITVQTANGPRQQFGVRIDEDLRNARFSDFKKGGRVTGGNTYDNDDSVAHALALTSEY